MGTQRPMTYVLNKLEESFRNKGMIKIGITPKISKEVLKEYIAFHSKEINSIISFFSTLKRGKGPIKRISFL
jgi:hypothetical protein